MDSLNTTMILENKYVKCVIGEDVRTLHFLDKNTGIDYCRQDHKYSFARVKKAGREYPTSAVSCIDGQMKVKFGGSRISAAIKVEQEKHYFVLEVVSVSEQVEEFTFADIQLTLTGTLDEPFTACALALNLQTNVPEIPGPNSRLRAACYPQFGFAGARVALIGCPQSELRSVMQEVVSNAKDLPCSTVGGPWALDAPINKGSYLFNFGNLTEETVDGWIKLAEDIGFTQIDFHGGRSFRFGDCLPNPEMYPKGRASLKAVIDKLHAAGILAGLHTYAFFMDKNCPWVTPVPDPRLGKDAVFTLAEVLSKESSDVFVVEPTQNMSNITGFFVRNSVTLQIDEELITYSEISREPPYAFTGCERGACGTTVSTHSKGAKVHHLKECFGLFTPDGDSTLLAEVAAASADTFNECGFDMIYLDALDGGDILGGQENSWHYGSKFVFELCKRLKKPALMEMSTFHHHLWFVRSRTGAWDTSSRSHKKFIDNHCECNAYNRKCFLPAHLGWASIKFWDGPNFEPTYPDDIEYLCCKAIGTDTGFSIQGFSPGCLQNNTGAKRLAAIIRQYETLRHSSSVPEAVKAQLRIPGNEFTLEKDSKEKWAFRRVQYAKHKVERFDNGSASWHVENKFQEQPIRLRIELLLSAGSYDAPDNIVLAEFADPQEFPERKTAQGVETNLKLSPEMQKAGNVCASLDARNIAANPRAAWTMMHKTFSPPINITEQQGAVFTQGAAQLNIKGHQQGFGLWIHGDGQGEILNIQLRSPVAVTNAIADHYITIDFTGWRYVELIEQEAERVQDYYWPYEWPMTAARTKEELKKIAPKPFWLNGGYQFYRQSVNYTMIESLSIWYNNLPRHSKIACYISPIKVLPLVVNRIKNPTITINGAAIVFPVALETGQYLEFRGGNDCIVYDSNGAEIRKVKQQGEIPLLASGENEIAFTCDKINEINPRTRITVIGQGKTL